MPLPSLPSDVWFRISTFLNPPDLSSLSQVNTTFHKIATDQTHFQRVLTVPQPPGENPGIAYRRLQAFSYLPSSATVQLSAYTDILCVVEDTLILLDIAKERLISFPNAHSANIGDLMGKNLCLKDGRIIPSFVRMQYAILPGSRMAFLKGSNPTHITVLDIKTWDMKKHLIPGKRLPRKAVLRGSRIFVAGNDGEWIMYHVDNETVALVDWRRGTIIRRIKSIPTKGITWKWLMGTCATTNIRSVVGVVHQESDGSNYEVHATGFDGVNMVFTHQGDRKVYSVLRSADTQTHILITRGLDPQFGMLKFYAERKISDSVQTWSGQLSTLAYSKLLLDGNVIEAKPQGHLWGSMYETCSVSQHFVELKDDCLTESIWSPNPTLGSQMVWCRRTAESGLAVVGGGSLESVKIKRLQKAAGSSKLYDWIFEEYDFEEEVHSWSVGGMINLCVLDDHVVVATRIDGRLESFHFDRFCRTEGVYACPFIVKLQSFRVPEQPKSAEPPSPPRKRRKRRRILRITTSAQD